MNICQQNVVLIVLFQTAWFYIQLVHTVMNNDIVNVMFSIMRISNEQLGFEANAWLLEALQQLAI